MLGLVNHALYLAIAAKRNPTDAVFRAVIFITAVLFLLCGRQTAQLAPPVEVGGEELELIVKEDEKLVDSHSKQLGEEEMSALMERHEDGDSEYKLKCTY